MLALPKYRASNSSKISLRYLGKLHLHASGFPNLLYPFLYLFLQP